MKPTDITLPGFVAVDENGDVLPGDWPQSQDRATDVARNYGGPLIVRVPVES